MRKLSVVAIFVTVVFLSLANVAGQNNANPSKTALNAPSMEPPSETVVVTGTFAPAPLGEIDDQYR